MATADKTRQKLVDSMRKSKTSAASKPAGGNRAATARKAKTPARRAPAKPAARQQRQSSAAALTAITWHASDDLYQSDGRIWPD